MALRAARQIQGILHTPATTRCVAGNLRLSLVPDSSLSPLAAAIKLSPSLTVTTTMDSLLLCSPLLRSHYIVSLDRRLSRLRLPVGNGESAAAGPHKTLITHYPGDSIMDLTVLVGLQGRPATCSSGILNHATIES